MASAVVLLHATPLGAQEEPPATVFTGVSVLAMDDTGNEVQHDRAVIVQGGEIAWMGPTGEHVTPAGAVRIDGTDRWLMPGLADMHAHMDASDIPLFLANGITTVREMNGSEEHLVLRDSIDRGLRPGPRLFVASPLLAGEEQRWRHELIDDAQAAYAIAHEAQQAGYDYLKVYDGLSKAAYLALAEASATLGLPLSGHIPEEVGLDGVLEVGQASIEHTEQLMYATVGHRPDPSRISEIVARVAATDTWVTPTLAAMRMLSLGRTPAYNERLRRPEMRFMDPGLMGWWRSLAAPEDAVEAGADDPRRRRAEAFYGFQRDLALALYEAGVPLLVGTDTPNPLLVPGYSIHLELAALAEAGIPITDLLRAATAGAARFTGDEAERGVVRVGAAADLVLLDADPREDLAALHNPVGVMVKGQWLDRATLERMLEEAEVGDSRIDDAGASSGTLLERAQDFRSLLSRGAYDSARAMMSPNPRRWFAPREGDGKPWSIGESGGGPWARWDEHFGSEAEVVEWIEGDSSVTAVVRETNDYYRLLERGPQLNQLTYHFDAAGLLEGLVIGSAGERDMGLTDEFQAWAQENRRDEIAELMPGGEIDPSHPERFRRLLNEWRQATGREPID